MRVHIVAAVSALAVTLSGCASVIKGSSETITITTPPARQASCTLTNDRGTWFVTTPGHVRVKRSRSNIDIHCKKPGFEEVLTTIPSGFEFWTLGNAVIGGVIGLAVDASTGAINRYERVFRVPMVPAADSYVPQYVPPAPPTLAPNS